MAPLEPASGAPRAGREEPSEFFGTGHLRSRDLATALEAVGTPEMIPPLTLSHQWLDTFDQRLRRAGFALELVQVRGDPTLRAVLEGPGAEPPWTAPVPGAPSNPARPAWRLDQLLPPGRMRERLAPAVGVRALLPALRLTLRAREFRIRNRQGKTVARLLLETRGGRRIPPDPTFRLRVQPLTGYPRAAAKLAAVVGAIPGVEAGAGGWPGALGPRPEGPETTGPPLLAGSSAGSAVRGILHGLVSAADANTPGVIADLDSEFLHDLRVAVRRARSALKLLGDCLAPGEAARLAAELKWMGDLTTPTRDLDVHIQALEQAPPADGEAAAVLLELLRRRRAGAQTALVGGLRSARWRRLRGLWRQVSETSPGPQPPTGALPIAELAGARVALTYRRARRAGRRVTDDSPPEDLHRLRKRCKELRYLLEFFSPLLGGTAHRRLLGQLRSLQDRLGEFQDVQVQTARLRELVQEAASRPGTSAETLLAIGEYDLALRLRGGRARAQLSGRFKRFAGRRARREVAELAGGPG